MENERIAFEVWATRGMPQHMAEKKLIRDRFDDYVDGIVFVQWLSWRACASKKKADQ